MRILFFAAVLLFTACSQDSSKQAQGYIEGKYTYLAANSSGKLTQLFVERGTRVSKDQRVFILDPEPEQSNLQEAEQTLLQVTAQLEKAEAARWLTEKTFNRQRQLYAKQATDKASLDAAQSGFEQATADKLRQSKQVKTSEAAVQSARWAQKQKIGAAPKAGLIFDTYYRLGEFVPAGRPVLSMLMPEDIKVIFFVKEANLARLKLAQPISLTCDACPAPIPAAISFISPSVEYTPPVIFSEETRQKLTYRVEAMMSPANAVRVYPGQPVTVKFK